MMTKLIIVLPSVILAGSANKSAYWKEETQGILFTEEEEEVGKEVRGGTRRGRRRER